MLSALEKFHRIQEIPRRLLSNGIQLLNTSIGYMRINHIGILNYVLQGHMPTVEIHPKLHMKLSTNQMWISLFA